MRRLFICTICFLTCVVSCQEADSFISNDEEIIKNNDELEWREEQNSWIYSQMKEHYFWNEELGDSLSYDYSLEPSKFFESMLVDEDRFSYCFYNEEYIPSTKGYNMNETVSIDTVFVYNNSFRNRKIGYFVYDAFQSEADVTDVILKFNRNRINDLIIDLRNNSGGSVATCIHLSSLLSSVTFGKLFCTFRYNRNLTEKLYRETGNRYEPYYFKSDVTTKNRNLRLNRVFFLVNNRSASASELIINCMKPYVKVITIGERTVGKDVGMYAIRERRYKYVLEPITFRTYNSLGDSVPQTGIIPEILVADKGNKIVPSLDEPYIKAATNYIDKTDYLEVQNLD